MGRYSSDSDSSRSDRRSRTTGSKSKRSRSSSDSSSTSHSYQKKSYRHKHNRSRHSRSRSRSRYSKSKHHHSRGNRSDSSGKVRSSRSRGHKSRKISRSRSRSRDRLRSRSKERSSWKSRSRSSSHSKRSMSHSKDRSKQRSSSSTPEKNRSRSSPDSRTECLPASFKEEPSTEEQLRAKLQKAIKAAQTADNQLRQQGLLSTGTSSSIRKEEILTKVSVPVLSEPVPTPLDSILNEINDTSFVPKQFSSSKSQAPVEQPALDLGGSQDSLKLLDELNEPACIFHSSLFVDPDVKVDKWIKKLFHLRQKAINGEPLM